MDYFGLNKIVSAILAFFIGFILGAIVRFQEGKPVAGILRLLGIIGYGFIINIIDLVCILVNGKMFRALEC